MYYIGLDAGSTYLKGAVICGDKTIATAVENSGISNNENANSIVKKLCGMAGITEGDLSGIIATGYSRRSLDIAQDTISEITAHAFGVKINCDKKLDPRLLIDVGGQDCKVICLGDDGRVNNFIMNDKCAAGTGKFIEVIADILDTTLDMVGEISLESKVPCDINSTCVVFAQTEVISLIAQKKDRKDILSGLHYSMAKRISKMARKHIGSGDIIMTGGGAKNKGLVLALEDELMDDINVAIHPQYNGAIGAALYMMTIKEEE